MLFLFSVFSPSAFLLSLDIWSWLPCFLSNTSSCLKDWLDWLLCSSLVNSSSDGSDNSLRQVHYLRLEKLQQPNPLRERCQQSKRPVKETRHFVLRQHALTLTLTQYLSCAWPLCSVLSLPLTNVERDASSQKDKLERQYILFGFWPNTCVWPDSHCCSLTCLSVCSVFLSPLTPCNSNANRGHQCPH